jgi:outer membrane protein TolC
LFLISSYLACKLSNMQSTHPFIALSIGAVLALSSVGAASSQTVPSSNPSPNLSKEQSADPDLDALVLQAKQSDAPLSTPTTEASESPIESSPDDATPSATPAESSSPTAQAPSEPLPSESLPLPGDATPVPSESETPADSTDVQPLPGDRTPAAAPSASAPVPAPDYLDPDPNPLLFPTQPEEVEVIGIQPITLRQAWELAQRNSRELQNALLELERTRAQLREAQAANNPTLQLQTDLTGDENQLSAQQRLASGREDDINLTLSGTVQLSYDLFTSGTRSSNIRANERQVRFQELQVETTAEQLRLDVANDYYDLQEADEQVRISQATLNESLRSLRDAEALERAGVGTRFDVLQAQVDVANSQQELTQNLSNQQIARRQLARRLNLAETLNLVSADPVEVSATWDLTLDESIVLAYRNRAELQQQLLQREISEYQRRSALGELGPQISLFANYSASDLVNATDTSTNSIFDNDNGNNDFNDTYSFGVRLNMNLYDGGAARARAAQQRANIAIAENQFADTRNQVRFDVEQAYLSLQANSQNIGTTTLALEQATEALRLARLRFQAGVGTQTDVLRSQTELTRAEVNQLNAILGYNRSLVQLQRAVSNLPDGNLAETP